MGILSRFDRATRAHVDPGIPISDVFEIQGELEPDQIAREVCERLRYANQNEWWERRRLWPRSLLYLYGEQDLLWDGDAGQWMVRQVSRVRRYQTNHLMARLIDFVAAMTQHRPSLTAVPPNDDLESKRMASIGERLYAFDWRDLRIGRARYYSTIDCAAFGTGILEVGYDPYGGDVEVKPEPILGLDGKPLMDAAGNPVLRTGADGEPTGELGYTGKMYVRSISPWHFFAPPNVENPTLEECPYVIRCRWASEAAIRREFSDKLPGGLIDSKWDIGSPDTEFLNLEPLQRYLGRYTRVGAHLRVDQGQHLIIEYFQRKCAVKGFEKGKIYSVVNGKLVGDRRAVRRSGRYPFMLFPWFPKRGRFWSTGWLEPQCDPQGRVNQLTSHLMTLVAIFSNPAILIPKGSGLPQTLSFNLTGYHYNTSAGAPSILQPPVPNQALFMMLDRAMKDLDAAGGQYSFSRGEPVPNVPSAAYANIMMDRDNSGLGPTVREHADSFEELGNGLAELHSEYDNVERQMTIVGSNRRPELMTFRGSDIPVDLRFVCQESSMYTTMPAAQQARVKELMGMNLITPKDQPVDPKMRKALLEFMQLPDLVDIETGTSLVDNFVKRILFAVVEGGQELVPHPMWPLEAVQALATAIDERVIESDAEAWDEAVYERLGRFKQAVSQVLAQAQKAAQQQALQDAEVPLQIEAAKQQIKSQGRIQEKAMGEAAKAGAQAMASETQPAVPIMGAEGTPGAEQEPPEGDM